MTAQTAAAPAVNSAPNTAGAKAAAEYCEALNLNLVDADPENRKEHEKSDLQALADQIKAEGLLQPVLVRPHPKAKGRYMLIAGERRWLAHKLNKATTIRAFIHLSEDELSAATKQTIENLGRKDLDPIEEARQLKRLADLGKTQTEIGKLVRDKSQSAVANTIKLLQLPLDVQKLIAGGELTAAHGQELVRFAAWPKACSVIAQDIAKCNKSSDPSDHWTAKALRDEDVPGHDALVRAKLAVKIFTGSEGYGEKSYQLPATLTEAQGFFGDRKQSYYSKVYYLLPADPKAPNLWEPERDKQDKARVEKAKQKEKTEERTQSTLSPAERAKRAKKISDNKQARLESELALTATFDHLRNLKTMEKNIVTAMVAKVLSDGHYASAVKEAATKLGLTIPQNLVSCSWYTRVSIPKLASMSELDQLRIAAAAVALHHGVNAIKFAHTVNDECLAVIGQKKVEACKQQAKKQLAEIAAAKAAKKNGGLPPGPKQKARK